MRKAAIISPCGKYRYSLLRQWDEQKPLVMFIMLNPSKADAEDDDPTIRRCMAFARNWGFGGIYVGNLFAYRSTDPDELLKSPDVICPENKEHLMLMADVCDIIVTAWGAHKAVQMAERDRPLQFIGGLSSSKMHYLALTKSGEPGHPLFLRGDLKPIKYSPGKFIFPCK